MLGATGEIGSAVVETALDAGHEVTAFARSAAKLGRLGDRARAIAGDVTDAVAVATAVSGHDAVINAIGSSPDPAQLALPATAMGNVMSGMERHGVRRLVGLAGGAVSLPGERKPLSGRLTSSLVRLMARNVVEAKQRELNAVAASALDWTMVRPPRVVDGPPTGRVVIGDKLHGFRVTRGDLAVAMLRLAAETSWLRQAPYVSERRS